MNLTHIFYALLNILNEMSPYILLGFFIAGLLHSFVRPETMSRHLAGHGWKPVFKAAMLGIPLPLCSCGVLPTAVSLRRQGASKGASASFLIATPQTGVDSIAATYALLGLPFAILRPIAALTGAMAGGMAVDRSSGDEPGESDASAAHSAISASADATSHAHRSFIDKLSGAIRYGFVDMVGSVGKWLVIGLVIAAVITVAVPDSFFLALRPYPILAMLAMIVVAVPMYICATGSIPIALSLMLKGLSPGVAFVMLMAGPAANFASVMVLRKSLGTRATGIYVGSVAVTAMAFGLIIDYLLPEGWFIPFSSSSMTAACHVHFNWFSTTCSAILIALLAYSALLSRRNSRRFHAQCACTDHCNTTNDNNNTTTMTTTVYQVKGMACNHCKATVEKVLSAIEGVKSVTVDLATGKVAVEGDAPRQAIADAVTGAGFEFVG